MTNENILELAKKELGNEEEILWLGQSDLSIVRRKAILIQGIAVFIVISLTGLVLYFPPRTLGLVEVLTVILVVTGILAWQLKKALNQANLSAKNVYAATPHHFVTLRPNLEDGTFEAERFPYKDIKHVHKMSIANGVSLTLVLKGGLIPNLNSFVVDGLDKDTRLYKIVKQKVNYL